MNMDMRHRNLYTAPDTMIMNLPEHSSESILFVRCSELFHFSFGLVDGVCHPDGGTEWGSHE